MKKIFLTVLTVIASLAVISCQKKDNVTPSTNEPVITWPSNPDFGVMELAPQMDVKLKIEAEAGIKSLVVTVKSDVLAPVISQLTSDGTANMDLINDAQLISSLTDVLGDAAFPMGDKLANQKSVDFDLSTLVPMILALQPAADSEHIFTLALSDNEDRTLSQDLKFHYTGEEEKPEEIKATVSDINLWLNTAVVTVTGAAEDTQIKVQYREKGSETWFDAAAVEAGKYQIAPVWNATTNDAGLDVFTLEEGTGVFAANTYEVQVIKNESETAFTTEFVSSEAGDPIPNGDMSGWTTIGSEDKPLPYPNAAGDSLWTSGNNIYNYPLWGDDEPTFLCSEDNGAAFMQSTAVLGAVFAAGNLFLGEFVQEGTAGVASFGQEYEWTARPKALRLKVKAAVNPMDMFGPNDPDKEQLEAEKPIDEPRIYISVTDWSARHGVKSGLGVNADEMNVWDPASQTSTDEGKIIGYGSLNIKESYAEFVTIEIPMIWYDTEAKPASGSISLGLACCTSSRGDYLTGSKLNKLWVDDFEWVY